MDYSSHCPDCDRETATIDDLQSGDTICSECGLVIESRYIDSTSEWRTFANDDGDGKDRSRVGDQNNLLLDGAALTTEIADIKNSNSTTGPFKLKKLAANNGDRNLVKGFRIITDIVERLILDRRIKDRACQIFKIMEEKKLCKGRNSATVFAAGTVYTACQESGNSRTLYEIAAVTEGGVRPKDISRVAKIIKGEIDIEKAASAAAIVELVRRFCNKIGLGHDAIKAVHEAVEKSEEIDVRRNPLSILAGIIYMICEIKGVKVPMHDLAASVQVAESTIKKTVADLSPHASRLIPSWFTGEESK